MKLEGGTLWLQIAQNDDGRQVLPGPFQPLFLVGCVGHFKGADGCFLDHVRQVPRAGDHKDPVCLILVVHCHSP